MEKVRPVTVDPPDPLFPAVAVQAAAVAVEKGDVPVWRHPKDNVMEKVRPVKGDLLDEVD